MKRTGVHHDHQADISLVDVVDRGVLLRGSRLHQGVRSMLLFEGVSTVQDQDDNFHHNRCRRSLHYCLRFPCHLPLLAYRGTYKPDACRKFPCHTIHDFHLLPYLKRSGNTFSNLALYSMDGRVGSKSRQEDVSILIFSSGLTPASPLHSTSGS